MTDNILEKRDEPKIASLQYQVKELENHLDRCWRMVEQHQRFIRKFEELVYGLLK